MSLIRTTIIDHNVTNYDEAIEKYKELVQKLNEISDNIANESVITHISDLTDFLKDKNNEILNNKIVGQYDTFIEKALREKITNTLRITQTDARSLTPALAPLSGR